MISFSSNLSLFSLFGFGFIFLIPFHNFYFGNSLVLLSSGSHHNTNVYPLNYYYGIIDIFYLNFDTENLLLIKNQILKWIQPKQLHYIFSFSIVCFYLFYKKSDKIIRICAALALSQHLVLLIYEPNNRYAYLAWILTIIVMFNYFKNLYQNFKKIN